MLYYDMNIRLLYFHVSCNLMTTFLIIIYYMTLPLGGVITPYIKIDKPLVVYISVTLRSDVHFNVAQKFAVS